MSGINPTQFFGTPTAEKKEPTKGPNDLGKDDFLKLLVGQLKNQSPLNPMGDQEFMGQMTQMSMLEQMTNMAADNKEANHRAAVDQAVGLMGKTVTYTDEDEVTHTGTVEKVSVAEGKVTLTVGGKTGIEPGGVTEVK